MIERVSSTQLSTFLDCPAKWRFQYCEGNEVQPNEAMSLGTIFHAIMECVVERGIYPTRSMVYAWPGNYEPTSSAMDLYPGGYEEAKKMAKHVGNPRKNEALSHLDWDNAILEQHTTEWGQFLDGDVTASGYIDVLIPSQRIVADWKTRRSFSYAPRSEDFRNNVQLCYYAALAARHYDWPDVTVMHMNVQRPDRAGHSRLMVVEATLSRQFLDEIWNYLDKVVVPQMKAVAAAKQHEAERNQASCFKYGPCMHRAYCNRTDQSNAELFAEMLGEME